jgi:hypothetical protein
MTDPHGIQGRLQGAVAELRDHFLGRHVLQLDGTLSSPMELPYPLSEERTLQNLIRELAEDLRVGGWSVLIISLWKLLLERVRAVDKGTHDALVACEKRLHAGDPERALADFRERIKPEVEGIAQDLARDIRGFACANADRMDRTLVIIGRAGPLSPFVQPQALLKYLEGEARNVRVILLCPRESKGASLSSVS